MARSPRGNMKKIDSLVELLNLKDSALSSALNILHSQSTNECRKFRHKHKFFFDREIPARKSRPNRRTRIRQTSYRRETRVVNLPGRGAVPVKNVEVLAAEQLAPIDAGLDGSETA